MRNAYKCNACGLISYNPGNHHDQPMVRVTVEDNVPVKATGPPTPSAPVAPAPDASRPDSQKNVDLDSSDEND